jgi:hypothetical protein
MAAIAPPVRMRQTMVSSKRPSRGRDDAFCV